MLLSKVLQNLANEVPFGTKEPYMANLNDFLVENKGSLRNFFDEVAVRFQFVSFLTIVIQQATVDTQDLEFSEVPNNVYLNCLCFFSCYIHENQVTVI